MTEMNYSYSHKNACSEINPIYNIIIFSKEFKKIGTLLSYLIMYKIYILCYHYLFSQNDYNIKNKFHDAH